MVLFVRRRACEIVAADAHIRVTYAIIKRRRLEKRKEGTRAGERNGVPRPPKVKSKDGGGPSGDRELQDAKSKREMK